jgi:hypothetical protein
MQIYNANNKLTPKKQGKTYLFDNRTAKKARLNSNEQTALFKLDTIGTTRSFVKWTQEINARYLINGQLGEIERELNKRQEYSQSLFLNRAAAVLQVCGRSHLATDLNGEMQHVHSYNCKKKYCPRCHRTKRQKLYAKFKTYFESNEGAEILDSYDVAILTVTLKHDQKTRPGWYFDELKKHFANILKYGAFKKYIKGGFYNTEINHNEKNGFHIHRHAVTLIPKAFNFRAGVVGNWREENGKRAFQWIDKTIPKELKAAWLKKTGDSFQLDLTPINPATGLLKNLLEVFKYIGKPYSNEAGENVLPAAVVEQLEKNSREKFNNRFGILYKVKELALNADQDERPDKEIGPLYIVKTPFVVNKKIEFVEIEKLPDSLALKDVLQNWALSTTRELEREREKYQNAAFQRAYSRERLRNWTLPANLGRQTNAINEDPFPLPY